MPDPRGRTEDELLQRMRRALKEHRMVRRGDRLLIAVSGGPDSVALLHLTRRLAMEFGLQLSVAHVHHGLRSAAADRDARFVSELAGSMGMPFHIRHADVGRHAARHRLSLEEAGRQLRYRLLKAVADAHGYGPIATGHQADDNAESILMFLLRGSGMQGVSGIEPILEDRWIRPLLGVGKEEILRFLHERGHRYVEDASNKDDRYMRNRIRNELMPLLRERFTPAIRQRLETFSHIVGDENRWIEETVSPWMTSAIVEKTDGRLDLSIDELARHPRPIQRRLLRRAIASVRGNLRRIGFDAVERGLDLLDSKQSAAVCLPGRLRISLERDGCLTLRTGGPEEPEAVSPFAVTIPAPGRYPIPEIGSVMRFSTVPVPSAERLHTAGHGIAFFDMSTIQFPLIVRNFRPGDRFRPLGLQGTQKIKKFFIDRKVPRTERSRIPLVVCGDAVVWIAGQRLDERVRVTASTRQVLQVEWRSAGHDRPVHGNDAY
ncbi:MAG: tRNA lysidine(34) synthetase TilS [Desulfobacteraceae bacterium]|nr:tRNA lysidine(34) synthetase TilS [Desulfobacteraceae bacterium]